MVSFSASVIYFFLKEACYQASFLSVVLVFDVNNNIPKMIDESVTPIEMMYNLIQVLKKGIDVACILT